MISITNAKTLYSFRLTTKTLWKLEVTCSYSSSSSCRRLSSSLSIFSAVAASELEPSISQNDFTGFSSRPCLFSAIQRLIFLLICTFAQPKGNSYMTSLHRLNPVFSHFAQLYIFNYTIQIIRSLAIFSDPCGLDFFDLLKVRVVCDADCLKHKCCGGNHAVTHRQLVFVS